MPAGRVAHAADVRDPIDELVEPLLVVLIHRDREVAEPDDLDAVRLDVLAHVRSVVASISSVYAPDVTFISGQFCLTISSATPSFITFWTWLLNQPRNESLSVARWPTMPITNFDGIHHLGRELAVDHEPDAELGLRILDVTDRRAELDRRHFADRDEVDLADEHVTAGQLVDEQSQERDVRRVQRVAACRETPDELAVLEEQRDFVGVDGELRVVRDVLVGMFVDPVVLCRVGACDRELMHTTLDEAHDSHVLT